ncbi:MAG TPA: hypothetical protein VFL16_18345 [Steroidobacteraceae bacterium]|nr:hypothetical protein [Steroidobacteraceae bacterium]
MARVPRVESPCPIAGKQLPAGATEHCTRCDRTVHNLDRMSERERHEFMGACSGQVCVAYTVRIPLASIRKRHGGGLAMATLAAAAIVSLPAATQTPETQTVEPPTGAMSPLPGAAPRLPNCDDLYGELIVVGGVAQGDQAEWADDGKDAPPDLPSMEDDGR